MQCIKNLQKKMKELPKEHAGVVRDIWKKMFTVNADKESALRIKDLGAVMRLRHTQVFRTLNVRMGYKKEEEGKRVVEEEAQAKENRSSDGHGKENIWFCPQSDIVQILRAQHRLTSTSHRRSILPRLKQPRGAGQISLDSEQIPVQEAERENTKQAPSRRI
jgi:hypothetical protein